MEQTHIFKLWMTAVMSFGGSMPDSQLESRGRPKFSPWGALSVEVVCFNLNVGTNIAKYFRQVAEIQVAAFLAIAAGAETPTDRRRKFRLIDGGKS
jgi:hypothetical protein